MEATTRKTETAVEEGKEERITRKESRRKKFRFGIREREKRDVRTL